MDRQRISTLLKASAAIPSRIPGWIRIVSGLLSLVAVLWFFSRRAGQTLDMVRQAWQPVSWLFLALAFLLLLVCMFIMALLWYGILRILGGRLPVPIAVRFYGLTLLPRYVPGMVWGYAGRALLCEREGISRKVAAASVVIEMALIVGSGFAIAILKYVSFHWLALVLLPAPILFVGLLVARARHETQVTGRLEQAARWYGCGVAYLGFWLLYGASTWLVALSVVPEIALRNVPEFIAVSAISWLAGFLAILVPSGLGVREAVFAVTIMPLAGSGAAVLIPLLARLIGMLAELAFFVLCLLFFRHRQDLAGEDSVGMGRDEGQRNPSGASPSPDPAGKRQ